MRTQRPRVLTMRLLLKSAVLWLTLSGGGPFAFGCDWDGARHSIVYIYFEGKAPQKEVKFQGTGFIVSRIGHVLTASHFLRPWIEQKKSQEGPNPIKATIWDKPGFASGSSLNLQVIDPGDPNSMDVALLKLPDPPEPYSPVSICPAEPHLGDTVSALGFPWDQNFQIVDRTLGNRNAEGGRWAAAHNFPGGMDGGPVYSAACKLIGLVKGGEANTEQVQWITPIRHTENLLRIAGVNQCMPPFDAKVENRPATPFPSFTTNLVQECAPTETVIVEVANKKTGKPIPNISVRVTGTTSKKLLYKGATNKHGAFISKSYQDQPPLQPEDSSR